MATETADPDARQPGGWKPDAFLRDGRLIRLPAKWTRKKIVLETLAAAAFTRGERYDEKTVNAKLKSWTDGGVTDHVTLRRYLVDLRLLARDDSTGTYWVLDPPGEAS
ncbi:DUF2087 domain-containing protein [Actinocorallia longicatena]|uniref:DUF2087 domain-containing protein n=1 Tax=Actinocorallia longicatena TaxID=111803 RepID=A0ABP6QCQ4_9ACTN